MADKNAKSSNYSDVLGLADSMSLSSPYENLFKDLSYGTKEVKPPLTPLLPKIDLKEVVGNEAVQAQKVEPSKPSAFIEQTTLPDDRLLHAFKTDSVYINNDGLITKSRSGIGNDQVLTADEYNKLGAENPELAAQGGALGVEFDQYGNQINNNPKYKNATTNDYKSWGTAGNLALGVGQLGLGVMSYLDNKKTAKLQRKLLQQQYNNNADLITDRKESNANKKKAFAAASEAMADEQAANKLNNPNKRHLT